MEMDKFANSLFDPPEALPEESGDSSTETEEERNIRLLQIAYFNITHGQGKGAR